MHSLVTIVVRIRASGADVGVLVLTRPQPRILHDILGFADAAEHPVRNREQQRSMRFECFRAPLNRCHGSSTRTRRDALAPESSCADLRASAGFRTPENASPARYPIAGAAGRGLPTTSNDERQVGES